jgi:hypothetical protein
LRGLKVLQLVKAVVNGKIAEALPRLRELKSPLSVNAMMKVDPLTFDPPFSRESPMNGRSSQLMKKPFSEEDQM